MRPPEPWELHIPVTIPWSAHDAHRQISADLAGQLCKRVQVREISVPIWWLGFAVGINRWQAPPSVAGAAQTREFLDLNFAEGGRYHYWPQKNPP